MQKLLAIAYTSTAIGCSAEKIETILTDAHEYNQKHGVTGVLLYSHGSFLQYIEGEEAALNIVYERIKNASSHRNIGLLMHSSITRRCFSDWLMAYAEPTNSEMLTIATAEWQQAAGDLKQTDTVCPGLNLLKTFWLVAQTRMESMELAGYAAKRNN